MTMRAFAVALLCNLLVLPAHALAYDVADVVNPRQSHSGWVTDEPGVLGDAADGIEQRLFLLNQDSGAEVAWVVVQSIGEREPRAFATALQQHWGVGRKGHDDGVLVLHVLDHRRIEIVTGYGVEAALPDIKCAWLLHEVAVPMFRAGEIARGHLALSRGIDRALRSPDISHADLIEATLLSDSELTLTQPQLTLEDRVVSSLTSTDNLQRLAALLLGLLAVSSYVWRYRICSKLREYAYDKPHPPLPVLLFVGMFMLLAGLPKPQLHIAFGILFVCVAWTIPVGLRQRRLLRECLQPLLCPVCTKLTRRLGSHEVTSRLSRGQQEEHKLGSVHFEAHLCPCGELTLESHTRQSSIKRCPGCSFRTLAHARTETIEAATEREPGKGSAFYSCAVCSHELREELVLPRITRSAAASSGSRSSSSSSSSSRSSSSSSSSSSGSSFGGGRSGGGGAGASY
jgi:uncharacterized protein